SWIPRGTGCGRCRHSPVTGPALSVLLHYRAAGSRPGTRYSCRLCPVPTPGGIPRTLRLQAATRPCHTPRPTKPPAQELVPGAWPGGNLPYSRTTQEIVNPPEGERSIRKNSDNKRQGALVVLTLLKGRLMLLGLLFSTY